MKQALAILMTQATAALVYGCAGSDGLMEESIASAVLERGTQNAGESKTSAEAQDELATDESLLNAAAEQLASCREFPCVIEIDSEETLTVDGEAMVSAGGLDFAVSVWSSGGLAGNVEARLKSNTQKGLEVSFFASRSRTNPWGLPTLETSRRGDTPFPWDSRRGWTPSLINEGQISTLALMILSFDYDGTQDLVEPLCEDISQKGFGCDGPVNFPLGLPVPLPPTDAMIKCCITHDVHTRTNPPTAASILAGNAELAACLTTAGFTGGLNLISNLGMFLSNSIAQGVFGVADSGEVTADCYCDWELPQTVLAAILGPRNAQGKNLIAESQCCDEANEKCQAGKTCEVSLEVVDLDTYITTIYKWDGVCKSNK